MVDKETLRRYRLVGIDPENPNPDGSDYRLMNIIDKEMELEKKIVGYFDWITFDGRITCEKYSSDRLQANVELTNYYKQRTLSTYPLNAKQWKLSLNELSILFPYKGDEDVD